MNKLSIEELKKMRKHAASLCHDSTVSALDELIAIRELKGEQVPVAWRHDSDILCHKVVTMIEIVANSWVDKGRRVTPLYDRPQKPVVLPEPTFVDMLSEVEDSVMRDGDYVWRVDDVRAAIEAAGGTVKAGE